MPAEKVEHCGCLRVKLFREITVLIVEGKTEEVFIPLIYEKLFGINLHSILVKVINRNGITDVPRFAEVLLEFVKPDVFILIDDDADKETESIIHEL